MMDFLDCSCEHGLLAPPLGSCRLYRWRHGGGSLWDGRRSLAEWIGSWFEDDKTDQPAPDAIAKQSQQLQNNKNMTFAPTIHLTPTGNSSYDQQMCDQILERLKAEFLQGMMGNMDVATEPMAA
ncbi:hypothetical protein DFP75_101597 [Marinomonas alcarazii]|uniref:Uncharacterized protein n=1 Tax=Marinomonas alcarazii TaxID=491949 RepID=A0A318VLJ0_9GAMM|nr:hypothetical protein [Marinomonas alcarazii]PYF84559.1 hypothetical protein DFP75_101597 [Marinomonas alcarazii]